MQLLSRHWPFEDYHLDRVDSRYFSCIIEGNEGQLPNLFLTIEMLLLVGGESLNSVQECYLQL